MTAQRPAGAPVLTVAVTREHADRWTSTALGMASAIDWCTTNGVWLHELAAGRVWVHGWADGQHLIQIEQHRPGRGGRLMPYLTPLPEGVGHLIRWDRPATVTHLTDLEGGSSCPSPA